MRDDRRAQAGVTHTPLILTRRRRAVRRCTHLRACWVPTERCRRRTSARRSLEVRTDCQPAAVPPPLPPETARVPWVRASRRRRRRSPASASNSTICSLVSLGFSSRNHHHSYPVFRWWNITISKARCCFSETYSAHSVSNFLCNAYFFFFEKNSKCPARTFFKSTCDVILITSNFNYSHVHTHVLYASER